MFTEKSKIADVWQNPIGKDILRLLLRKLYNKETFAQKGFGAGLRLSALDRFVGKDFAKTLAGMMNEHPGGAPTGSTEQFAWWKEGSVYHIYLPSFMDADHDGVGDIAGVMQRLPYLKNLGISSIMIWPLLHTEEAEEHNIVDYRAIANAVGGLDDFTSFVEAAHALDIKLVLGLDLSFTSDEHPWFKAALQGDEKYKEYYYLHKGKPNFVPNNWALAGERSAWVWYEQASAWGLSLSRHHGLDLNWDNPAVREEARGILEFWLAKGVDGFVLNSINLLSKNTLADGNVALGTLTGFVGYEHFFYGKNLQRYIQELCDSNTGAPTFFLAGVAAALNHETTRMVSCEVPELGVLFDDPYLPLLRAGAEENNITLQMIKSFYLSKMQQNDDQFWMPLYIESPDQPRLLSRLGVNPVYRGILSKMLGTLMFTLRGTPVIYQGQELGLLNTRFNNIAEVRSRDAQTRYAEYRKKFNERMALQKALFHAVDYARTPMPWNPGSKGGFTGAEPWMRMPDNIDYLNVSTQMQDRNSVWRHYQHLVELHRTTACLQYGSFNAVFAKNKKVFCYFRMLEGKKWYVELNITDKTISRPGHILSNMVLKLSNYEEQAEKLRPYEANLYRCD